MTQHEHKPMLLPAMLGMKCPSCRKGIVFKQKSYWPLGSLLALNEKCTVCGQKLMSEKNNGGGINYALTVIILFLNLLWYWPIFGISYVDNSIYYFLATSTGVAIVLQPWLMRMSRMLYLYLYVGFGATKSI